MSIDFKFKEEIFSLEKLQLPSRYYYFNDQENYVKLLCIGEGIFPKDKIRTRISLENSNAIITTESATKIYPSKNEFGINSININLQNSNLEFINDELILFKDAKLLQLLKIKADESSTFFYGDILSHGRSYENFDFTVMSAKNSFYCEDELEYLEKYNVNGFGLQDYIKDNKSENNIFAKLYLKTHNNEYFLDNLKESSNQSFSYTSKKKMIIGVISANNMSKLKKKVLSIWSLYRLNLEKKEFNLGKQ
ncbi:urease accessory protein UreD [Arcobacteraceae bacterium]|nr:urease accessory protein UreD [Arcobacteraceae bacterium]